MTIMNQNDPNKKIAQLEKTVQSLSITISKLQTVIAKLERENSRTKSDINILRNQIRKG